MVLNMAAPVTEHIPVYRYERKFVMGTWSPEQCRQWVRQHPKGFFEQYPSRDINNIYYDTPGFEKVFENLDGVSMRKKVRVRWYGDQFGETRNPVLEIKIKSNLAGYKRSTKLLPFLLQRHDSNLDLRHLLRRPVDEESWFVIRSNLRPVLLNRYHRQYFRSFDGRFRFTIDYQQEFFRIDRVNNDSLGLGFKSDQCILELKYNIEHDAYAPGICQHLPFRVSKNSKYVNGMLALHLNKGVW